MENANVFTLRKLSRNILKVQVKLEATHVIAAREEVK